MHSDDGIVLRLPDTTGEPPEADLAVLTRVMDDWLDQLDPQHILRRDPSELPGGDDGRAC